MLEITPEPPEGERQAVEAALARILAPAAGGTSAWWRAGVEESVGARSEEGAPDREAPFPE